MTQHQQIEGYKSQAKRAFKNLLTDGPQELAYLLQDIDRAITDDFCRIPATTPKGVEITPLEIYTPEGYTVLKYRIEKREENRGTYWPEIQVQAGGIKIWYTADNLTTADMLQIMAHDRQTRPEAYTNL